MTLDLHAPVADLTRALIDVESVSGSEAALADQVEAALAALPHLTVARDGDAVVARTDLGRAERVAIVGHLDTVPIKDNVPSRLEGEGAEAVIWGRGAVDMKAGVAVQLSVAAAVTEPTRDVTYIFYDHEEVEEAKNGLGRLARVMPDALKVDFAVLGEPTLGDIEGGCNGSLRFRITVPGKAAHSARAWKGVNAIHGAAPLLSALAAYAPATVTVDGLDYREGLNAVGIEGGIAGNVIPDECVVTVNYRFAPDKMAAQATAHALDVFAAAGVDASAVEVVDEAEGCRPGLDAPIAQGLMRAADATGAAAPRAKVGWTDVARFGALGIPAVNYGPGDPELAHADDERVPVAQIDQVRKGLESWLKS